MAVDDDSTEKVIEVDIVRVAGDDPNANKSWRTFHIATSSLDITKPGYHKSHNSGPSPVPTRKEEYWYACPGIYYAASVRMSLATIIAGLSSPMTTSVVTERVLSCCRPYIHPCPYANLSSRRLLPAIDPGRRCSSSSQEKRYHLQLPPSSPSVATVYGQSRSAVLPGLHCSLSMVFPQSLRIYC